MSSRGYQWVPESTADLLMHRHPNKFEVAREGIVESVLESDTQNGTGPISYVIRCFRCRNES